MVNAAKEYADFLSDMVFQPLQTPVIANVTAEPYPQSANDEDIKSLLVRQIHSSVRWTDSIKNIKTKYPDAAFEELGPGNVLTKLIRQVS